MKKYTKKHRLPESCF